MKYLILGKDKIMKKNERYSKIYLLILIMVFIVSMCGGVSAYTMRSFSYTGSYPNYGYRTKSQIKEDACGIRYYM